MGLLSMLTNIVNGPYRYRAGPRDLGVGVENLALITPGKAVPMSFRSAAYMTQRNMALSFPTVPQTGFQMLPNYDLKQGGAYLTGTVLLNGLVNMNGNGQ